MAAVEPTETVPTELAPPKPIEEIPADPARPPADDPLDSDPDPATVPAVPPSPQPPAVTPRRPLPGTEDDAAFEQRMHAMLHPDAPAATSAIPPVESEPLLEGDAQVGPAPSIDNSVGLPPAVEPDAMMDLDTPISSPSAGLEWLSGIGFGTSLSTTYDTNIYQTSGRRGIPKEDDFIFSVNPYISYGSDKYGIVYAAKLVVDADDYLNHSDLSGVGYAADFRLGYDGRRFKSDFAISQELAQGVDRSYAAYVEKSIFKVDEALAYKISKKSSIEGRLGYASESPHGRNFFDTSREYGNIAFGWQSSSLLKLAAGLGWTRSEGEKQATRDTVGPLMRLDYKLSTKLLFDGEVGIDFITSDTGNDNGTSLSTKIVGVYTPSRFWSYDLSVLRNTVPDGSQPGAYREVFSVRGGVKKKIKKVDLALGLGYELNQYSNSGSTQISNGGDRNYVTIDLAATWPLYKDKADLSVFTRYREETDDDTSRSWSGSQFGISLKSAF